MAQQKEKPKRKKKAKKEVKSEFDPSMVFDVEAKHDLAEMQDADLARYKARKGQGGTRRT